jgi:hypothetical protein
MLAHAQGQGFMVKPFRLETLGGAGQLVELPLQIRNIAGQGSIVVNLRLVELTQSLQGGWRPVEPDSDEDTSSFLSSRQWTSLSSNQVTVAPLQPADVTVRISVPTSARGVYFAGVIAETPAPENPQGVSVRVRFLIPIIVYVQGRPVPQSVALDNISMAYRADPGTSPTTTAHLRIVNLGRTFPRVRGTLRVEREHEGRWRSVTSSEIPEKGIIPGATLELGDDLRRRLPSGTYRLRGELFVDGRRVAALEEEVAFEGDPTADAVAYDTALILSPPILDLDVLPGASRTTIVRVENPGDDPIDVVMSATIPRDLLGVETDRLSGGELSAAAWTEIRPSEFTIEPGRWQNIRVVSRVPREGAPHPHYYADLVLDGTYPDGQSAGQTRSTVRLANREGETVVDGAIELLQLAEGETPASYIVQVRLANIGNVDIQPFPRAALLSPQGRAIRNAVLSGDDGVLLPLGRRTYSGELDLSDVSPGYYALRALISLAPGREIATEQVLLVEEDDGLPVVTVLDSAAIELPEEVELPQVDPSEETAVHGQ